MSQRSLLSQLKGDLYTEGVIKNSLRFYIEPDCQSVDPAGGDEPNLVVATRETLFEKCTRNATGKSLKTKIYQEKVSFNKKK